MKASLAMMSSFFTSSPTREDRRITESALFFFCPIRMTDKARPDDVRRDEARQERSDQIRSDQSAQTKSNQIRSHQIRPD